MTRLHFRSRMALGTSTTILVFLTTAPLLAQPRRFLPPVRSPEVSVIVALVEPQSIFAPESSQMLPLLATLSPVESICTRCDPPVERPSVSALTKYMPELGSDKNEYAGRFSAPPRNLHPPSRRMPRRKAFRDRSDSAHRRDGKRAASSQDRSVLGIHCRD